MSERVKIKYITAYEETVAILPITSYSDEKVLDVGVSVALIK
jgi:hypothetical protein